MKVYKCDSCGVEIKNPHEQKMKEFCFSAEIDEHGIFPKFWKRKVKIHLCNDCFIGLYIIKKRKELEKGGVRPNPKYVPPASVRIKEKTKQ